VFCLWREGISPVSVHGTEEKDPIPETEEADPETEKEKDPIPETEEADPIPETEEKEAKVMTKQMKVLTEVTRGEKALPVLVQLDLAVKTEGVAVELDPEAQKRPHMLFLHPKIQ